MGGYNSSNTTHLAELASQKVKTYFINSPDKIFTDNSIKHFDFHSKEEITTSNFLPDKRCKIILTSGASCPDVIIEKIMRKISAMKKETINIQKIIKDFESNYVV